MHRIRLWSLRLGDHSGVLVGAGGTWRSGWPARALANELTMRVDRKPACEEQSIACVHGASGSLYSAATVSMSHRIVFFLGVYNN